MTEQKTMSGVVNDLTRTIAKNRRDRMTAHRAKGVTASDLIGIIDSEIADSEKAQTRLLCTAFDAIAGLAEKLQTLSANRELAHAPLDAATEELSQALAELEAGQ